MTSWNLPAAIEVAGIEYQINSDFRPILDILKAHNDPNLPDWGKMKVMIEILYIGQIPEEHLQEAVEKAKWFIDCGQEYNGRPKPRTMDWEQDAAIIFPAVNKIAGYEVRNPERYTHWWTFLGFFYEIEGGLFSQVLSIRQKKAKGKKLEKYEKEFEQENLDLVRLKSKLSDEEKDLRRREREAVDALFR